MSEKCHEPPLPANGCTRAGSLSNSLISRNSRSAQSASASSKGRSCRHCSDRRKSQASRNSASHHRTRNSLGLDRYTKGAGCGAPCAKPKLSGRKLEGCYSVADDSPAGSRSRASVAPDECSSIECYGTLIVVNAALEERIGWEPVMAVRSNPGWPANSEKRPVQPLALQKMRSWKGL